MVKIVYGVSGEGSGHSSRARELGRHLSEQGHEVWMASYDRGYRNLSDEFRVFEIEGLCIASENNKVSIVKTFTKNLKRLPQGHQRLQALRKELFKTFQPDCVLTDFEPMTAYLARHYDLPLISVDNQHRMRYVQYECPPGRKTESKVTKTIIRAMVPKPDVSLITTFFVGEPRNHRTFQFPPIVRQEVRDLTPSTGDHVVVYATAAYGGLLDTLSQFTRESFRCYGFDEQSPRGPLQFRPFSKTGFLDDLASARAVIATAGFTLISESLYLGKPYLALPMDGQFEQQLNAFQLQRSGYGRCAPEARAEQIASFLYHLPELRARLADYPRSDSRELKAKLDELLAHDAASAREFHDRRKS